MNVHFQRFNGCEPIYAALWCKTRPLTSKKNLGGRNLPCNPLRPPWKNLLGIVENYWTLFEKFGPLSENSSPHLVFQAGYEPGQNRLMDWLF